MSITVQNNSRNLSSIYKYNNFKNTKAVFSSELAKTTQVTNNNVSNVANVKYGQDDAQTLIEDQKLYENQLKRGHLSNIKFGSEEWNQWKIDHTNNFFPPLDAPAQVRQAWREVKESIPEDDKKARRNFQTECVYLLCEAKHPYESDIADNFQLNTTRDYEDLLNFSIRKNSEFADMVKNPDEKKLYTQSVELSQKLKNKLHEVLFGL